MPLAVRVTPANVPDGNMAIAMLDAIPAVRGKQGHPVSRPLAYLGDRAYGWVRNIKAVKLRGVKSMLAKPRDTAHGSGLGRLRWPVEATLSWYNNWRRLRVCYERTCDSAQAFHDLASALICWRKLFKAHGERLATLLPH